MSGTARRAGPTWESLDRWGGPGLPLPSRPLLTHNLVLSTLLTLHAALCCVLRACLSSACPSRTVNPSTQCCCSSTTYLCGHLVSIPVVKFRLICCGLLSLVKLCAVHPPHVPLCVCLFCVCASASVSLCVSDPCIPYLLANSPWLLTACECVAVPSSATMSSSRIRISHVRTCPLW